MAKDSEKTPGYLDIAFDFGVEIMESGLIDPALYQALSDPETRKKIILPVVQTMRRELFPKSVATSNSDDSPSLPSDHYRVHVTYASIPSIEELEKEWGKGNVSVIFDGRPFTLHASCEGMDRTPGEKTFYLHDAGGDWQSEEQIAWGIKQRNAVAPDGYRPATQEETHEFSEAHPELVDYVGLGAFAVFDGLRCVAGVWQRDGRRILGHRWFGSRWSRGSRVLFVSRSAGV